MSYLLHLLVLVEIYALVAASLNLLVGFGGVLQLAHAATFGVGAYTYALVAARIGFFPALLLAALAAATFGVGLSLVSWRLRGDAFVVLSLAVQAAMSAAFLNWVSLTGGPYGLHGIRRPAIGAVEIASAAGASALFLVVVGTCLAVLFVIVRSPFGIALQATRDDPVAALSVGLSERRLRAEAFGVAGLLVGSAGALYAAYSTYIDPKAFTVDESIVMLSMVIVGGCGGFVGPILGAAILVALPELLRLADLPAAAGAQVRLAAYGLLMALLMRWRPQGLAGRYRFD